jgi:hypothetical protein
MASFLKSTKLIDLLQHADPKGEMAVLVLADGRLGLGTDPLKPVIAIDLGAEQLAGLSSTLRVETAIIKENRPVTTSYGQYQFEIRGHVIRANSLKDILRHALLALERITPGTLDKLSMIKPRSKRIVSRDRSKLFDTAKLTGGFSEQLDNEWWFGTNNSAQETKAWLERAARCAELSWGRDCSATL